LSTSDRARCFPPCPEKTIGLRYGSCWRYRSRSKASTVRSKGITTWVESSAAEIHPHGLPRRMATVVLAACLADAVPIRERSRLDTMSQDRPSIKQVKQQHEMDLLSIDDVEGVGIGEENDRPVIKVYVAGKTRELEERLPRELEGYPVRIEVSGEFHTLPAGGP
jgi:hypothetical protein